MQLVYLNPHADDFIAKPLSFFFAKRRPLCKYAYLFDGAIAEHGAVDVLVDGSLSSLLPQRVFMWLPKWMRLAILRYELSKWLQINNLKGKAKIHWNTKLLNPETPLYFFSYKNCVAAFCERLPVIEFFHRKIINLSHYFICTGEKAGNISKLSNVTLATEADVSKNAYFRKYFGEKYPLLILPFQVGKRFQVRLPFGERQKKCAATGSFHNLFEEKPRARYQDFIEFFNRDSYHPVRKLIYQNRDQFPEIVSKISPYREGKKSVFAKLARFLDTSQKKYFSFDIVDFYNDYQCAIIGEEIHGLPAIGAFEAMACGCVLIAEQGDCYSGLGVEANTHYVTHDGTIEGIKSAIQEVVSSFEKSEKVSQNGVQYIEGHCRSKTLWQKLCQELERKDKAA